MFKKKDLPAMPFYIGDWKKDPGIQVLSKEEKMIWFEMLMLMWESEERGYLTIKGKPISNKLLSVALNLDSQRLTDILTFFEELDLFSKRKSDSAIFSRKIIHIIEVSDKRSKAGRQGGNPSLLNLKLTKKLAKGLTTTETESESEDVIEIKEEKRLLMKKEFLDIWNKYPKRDGKKEAEKHFNASIKNAKDCEDINIALENYLKCESVKNGYIKNGSTWFNNWRDWIDFVEPVKSSNNKQSIKRHSEKYSNGTVI